MDHEPQPRKHNDATRRHRRSASHLLNSTAGKDFGRDISEKLQELARINTLSGSATTDLNSDYVLPGIPSTNNPRHPPTKSSIGTTGEIRPARYSRSRSLLVHGHSSFDDLRSGYSSKSYSKPHRTNLLSETYFATAPRQDRPSRDRTQVGPEFFRPVPVANDENTRSSTDADSLRGESNVLEANPRKLFGHSGIKQNGFGLERNDSPARAVYGSRMLHLMSATRGKMKGRLFFRKTPLQDWAGASCWIDQETGSLLSEPTAAAPDGETIVRDLRGCRVQTLLEPGYSSIVLVVRSKNSTDVVQLRPEDETLVDTWFAALLCWQPVQPAQKLNHGVAGGDLHTAVTSAIDPEIKQESYLRRRPAIIKVGKAFFMESQEINLHTEPLSPYKSDDITTGPDPQSMPLWKRVSCTLRDNGELKIYTTTDVATLATVRLADLTRSSVQRVHSSVSGLDFCLAVYHPPLHSVNSYHSCQPIFLSFDSRVLFEVWFVLFRTFTGPEIQRFGPPPVSHSRRYSVTLPGASQELGSCLFRIERTLQIQVAEAKLKAVGSDSDINRSNGESPRRAGIGQETSCQYYTRVFLDGQLKAKSSAKSSAPYLLWYENFNIVDVSPQISNMVVQARARCLSVMPNPPRLQRSARGILSVRRSDTSHAENETDAIIGEATIDVNKLHPGVDTERWWNLVDENGNTSGELLMKIRLEREVILMDCEYAEVSQMLHEKGWHFTVRIAEKISAELPKLAECLLNIYQASGQANQWLMSLAEEEVDGMRKEIPLCRTRSEVRIDSNGSRHSPGGSPSQSSTRASLARELKNSALAEANLLFRGNTLLSKALDLHMKRLGKDYLEGAIGAKMRAIAEQDPECEVDPNRIKNEMDMPQNWECLLSLTREVWSLIYNSCSRCPAELRLIFRHIRACTDDRYGEQLPNVRYSSVSGFLFLRFFCPAVLNPSLFGLLNEHPKPRAQRTFTLIAKSLQGLANQALFGVKEPWMGPMNQFLDGCREQFKDFIDSICSLTPDQETPSMPPAYSTPLAMFTRLPQLSREGLPSLPYLIDHTRNFASLVNLWANSFPSKGMNITTALETLDHDLRHFHEVCMKLRIRTQSCLAQAEQDEKHRSSISEKWQAIAEQIGARPGEFREDRNVPAVSRMRPLINLDMPTSGRDTPSTPVTTPGVNWSDDGTPGSASGLASGPPSSIHLSSPTSSDMEPPGLSPSSRGKREAKEKDSYMLNLFARRLRRGV